MSNLIKREDAIKAIHNYWKKRLDTLPTADIQQTDKILEHNKTLCNFINAIPSADRPQEWIPCSERLPEEKEWIGTKKFGTTISDKVLVTFESRGKRFVKPIHFQNGELGGMDKHTMDAVYGEWQVVAWMPLPKPWKGADND